MENLYDVAVIGGGPAGLTAAIYLARARYRVAVLEKSLFGGQVTTTHEVINYPGVERTSGDSLTASMARQAENFGAELLNTEAKELALEGDVKTVKTGDGEIKCFGVLLATGASPRTVGFEGETEFRGRGVAYCATCDGSFFTGKEIFVIGGGYAAAEESVFLTKFASHVTVVMRGSDFSCARSLAEEARNHPKISVLTETQVQKVSGEGVVTSVTLRNKTTGEITEHTDENGIGVFVFAGSIPATELVKDKAQLDERGYVITDRNMKTTADGLYAAGDICVKNLRQVVTAVADGALAATELEKLCSAMQRKTGLHPQTVVPAKKENTEAVTGEESGGRFDGETRRSLQELFSSMESNLTLKLRLDDRPVSGELDAYMSELSAMSDTITVEKESGGEDTPCTEIWKDGKWTGLAFHGIPGGHEFTSFVLGLYNAAGPGQKIEADSLAAAVKISKKTDIKVLVTLSCTMCPELVTAAQRLAAENPNVTARVYDLAHFPELGNKYNVMSVPCLIINDGQKISFGRKSLKQLIEIIES